MAEVAVGLFVAALFWLVWRAGHAAAPSAGALWVLGWGVLLVATLLNEHGTATFGVRTSALVGPFFSGFLLVGAMVYGGTRIPLARVWIAIGVLGVVRFGLAWTGQTTASAAVGVGVEPALDLAAAVIVARADRDAPSLPQRLLPLALVAIAAVDALSAVLELRGLALPENLLAAWVTLGVVTLSLQATAAGQREGRLRRALEDEVVVRRLAVAELREAEGRYRTVSELSSDFSFALRILPDGRLALGWMTQAAERLTGYSYEELAGIRAEGLVHADDIEHTQAQLARARLGEPISFHTRIIRKDGEIRVVFARIATLRDELDGEVRIVGVTSDITEVWRAQEERSRLEGHLSEVQRLEGLGALTGGIAHDFNNALSVILGNCSVAEAELPEGSPLAARLARIRSAARHASALTQQMLAYAGRSPPKLESIDLTSLVRESWQLLEASVGSSCQLEAHLEPDLPAIEADATQMRQVLVNLVANASEALAGRPGRVRVVAGRAQPKAPELADAFGADPAPTGPCVYVEVSDDGPGMDRETARRIFEPFFTTKFSGRGLGLAAVLGIVRGHGGVISVSSEPGHGARFRVLLPEASRARAQPRPAAPDAAAAAAAATAATRRQTVLVIDDDEAVREVATLFLDRAGYGALTAASGREGIELVRDRGDAIDAVLLDLAMPELDGESTLKEIRSLRPSLPVVVVSGHVGDASGASARAVLGGASGFLRKPYEPETLAEAIRAALARP